MSTIYKFALNLYDANTGPQSRQLDGMRLEQVLHVGLDPNGSPCVWCRVYPCAGIDDRLTIDIVGTGQRLGNTCQRHIGSIVDGSFVWHVFTP